MAEENPGIGGFFGALRQMGATVLALVFSRLELAGLEWREERTRLAGILLWSAVFVSLVFMLLIAITFLVVVAFWEHAVWVLLGFGLFYLCGACLALRAIVRRMKAPVFPETISQMKKDREWLLGTGK